MEAITIRESVYRALNWFQKNDPCVLWIVIP